MSGSILSGRYGYYYCRATRPDPKNPHKCEARYVKADQIETAVMAELSSILERPEVVLNGLLERQDGGSSLLDGQIAKLSRDIRTIEDQEQRLIRLYRYGEVDDEFIKKESKAIRLRKERMVSEVHELQERASNLSRLTDLAPQIREVCERIHAAITEFGFDEQRLVLDAFSIKVIAYRDRVEVRGAMPSYFTTGRTSGYTCSET